jgi:hypothetical protein
MVFSSSMERPWDAGGGGGSGVIVGVSVTVAVAVGSGVCVGEGLGIGLDVGRGVLVGGSVGSGLTGGAVGVGVSVGSGVELGGTVATGVDVGIILMTLARLRFSILANAEVGCEPQADNTRHASSGHSDRATQYAAAFLDLWGQLPASIVGITTHPFSLSC